MATMMNIPQGLNPTQLSLLRLFSVNGSEEFAIEIKKVLTRYLQDKLDKESQRLWDNGILNQKKFDEIRHTDLHLK